MWTNYPTPKQPVPTQPHSCTSFKCGLNYIVIFTGTITKFEIESFILTNFLPTYSSVTPEQWVSFTNENIINSEKERDASSSLRGVINGVIEQTQQDILKQRNAVNLAFAKRIHETLEAKQQLEQHLGKVS